MKQFGKILKFEFKNYLQNKIFVGVTAFLVVLIALIMFFPRLGELFADGTETGTEGDELPIMLVWGETAEESAMIQSSFSAAFTGYEVKIAEKGIDDVKTMIQNGEVECAFAVKGLNSYTYYVNNLSMYDGNTAVADEILQTIYRMNAMIVGGLSVQEAQMILSTPITHEVQNLGVDQMQNFFYTYIMMVLYMVILLYGQMVASNVAGEKSSRAMELLITSANPVSMMFGKVLASCLAGLSQLVAVFGSALLFYNLNASYWNGNPLVKSIFDMPIELFIYMLIFFVLGFFIYAFLYGAIGSTASKLEDINTSVMPITLLFIAGFFVVVFSMSAGDVDNLLMHICSYIPFTSPMAMFTRIAMSTVPIYEILISIAILIGSVFGIGYLAAKIYRAGVLLYGTPPKISAILKAIYKA